VIVKEKFQSTRPRATCGYLLTPLVDLFYQIIENKMMERQTRVPIQTAQKALGVIMGCNAEVSFSIFFSDVKLQPRPARQAHFSAQE